MFNDLTIYIYYAITIRPSCPMWVSYMLSSMKIKRKECINNLSTAALPNKPRLLLPVQICERKLHEVYSGNNPLIINFPTTTEKVRQGEKLGCLNGHS